MDNLRKGRNQRWRRNIRVQIVIGATSWNPLFEIQTATEPRDSPVQISDKTYKTAVGQESGEPRPNPATDLYLRAAGVRLWKWVEPPGGHRLQEDDIDGDGESFLPARTYQRTRARRSLPARRNVPMQIPQHRHFRAIHGQNRPS